MPEYSTRGGPKNGSGHYVNQPATAVELKKLGSTPHVEGLTNIVPDDTYGINDVMNLVSFLTPQAQPFSLAVEDL